MSSSRTTMQSNLECFLDCITPVVPARLLPKTSLRSLNRLWQPWDKETVEYCSLGDLWNRYDEWSAYGAGTPIVLNSEESVIQYYVPYLSAIQIYTSNSYRGERDEFGDSVMEIEENENMWRWWDASSEDFVFEQDNLWHLRDRLGYLYFQYFERSAPYGRIPLMDKINEAARGFPGLMSLKSVDLSPASWMAVAWYPIYHIPTVRTVKDLSACFLTYHTLSSSFQDSGEQDNEARERKGEGMALPPFGMATYKMQGDVWMCAESRDRERMISLLSAADSWLKQLGVRHHDFDYFTGIRHG
ncbi:hypothetical protein AMTRI_Chr02g222480 [Amborella trichopoda]